MQFPYYFHFFGVQVHPHRVMEGIAYVVGLSTHLVIKARVKRGREGQDLERGLWNIVGAVLGALVGAKLLAWAESFQAYEAQSAITGIDAWLDGKTIVGGLVGGWIGVEIAKKITRSPQRTGDTWVYPLVISIAIGRVGCFLTGLSDQTHGIASRLPWAVDFGDGIPRHPTQLYEIAFLLLLGIALFLYQRAAQMNFTTGKLFRLFMLAYCSFRFLIEFIKPSAKPFLGLSAIQIVSLLAAIFSAWQLSRSRETVLVSTAGAP